jgi:hypothetical protein
MIIIAIGHGNGSDPFTCSLKVTSAQKEFHALASAFAAQGLQEDAIDEILVVENDDVVSFVRPYA